MKVTIVKKGEKYIAHREGSFGAVSGIGLTEESAIGKAFIGSFRTLRSFGDFKPDNEVYGRFIVANKKRFGIEIIRNYVIKHRKEVEWDE